jgi:hypothetical protein
MTGAGMSLAGLHTVADPLAAPTRLGQGSRATACPVAAAVAHRLGLDNG